MDASCSTRSVRSRTGTSSRSTSCPDHDAWQSRYDPRPRMMTRALTLLFLVACSKGQASRDNDCKAIKAIVGKTPGDMPRRYRNTIVEGSFDELNKLALGDPGVKKAVHERDAT